MSDCPAERNLTGLLEGQILEADWPPIRAHLRQCGRCRQILEKLRLALDRGRSWRHATRRLCLTCPPDALLGRWLHNQASLSERESVYLAGHLLAARCSICRERLRRTVEARQDEGLLDATRTIVMLTQRAERRDDGASEQIWSSIGESASIERALKMWGDWAESQSKPLWIRREFERVGTIFADGKSTQPGLASPSSAETLAHFLAAAGSVLEKAEGHTGNSWRLCLSELDEFDLTQGEWIRDRVARGVASTFGRGRIPESSMEARVALQFGEQEARRRILEILDEEIGAPSGRLLGRLWHEPFLAGRSRARKLSEPIVVDLSKPRDVRKWVKYRAAFDEGVLEKCDEDRAVRQVSEELRKYRGRSGDGARPTDEDWERLEAIVRNVVDGGRAGADGRVALWTDSVFKSLRLPFGRVRVREIGSSTIYHRDLDEIDAVDERRFLALLVFDIDVHRAEPTSPARFLAPAKLLVELEPHLTRALRDAVPARFVKDTRRAYGRSAYDRFLEKSGS